MSWIKTITGILYHSKIHCHIGDPRNVGESLKGKGRKLGDVPSVMSSGATRIHVGILMRTFTLIILVMLCLWKSYLLVITHTDVVLNRMMKLCMT